MCVIPLIIEGPNRNIVEKRQEFESAGGVRGELILIQGLDRDQLLSPNNTNVSYDLRVGGEYRDHRDVSGKPLSEDGVIKLLPGATMIVETEEFFHFPNSAFGHVIPRVSLLQKGISITSFKVDPGYNGRLLVTVFNLGKRTVQLRRGETFCAIYVLRVLEGARPYDKSPKRIVGEPGA